MIAILICFIILIGIIAYHSRNTSYRCKFCGNMFKISIISDLFSLHNSNTIYIKCPKCKKRGWQKIL